MLWYAVRHAAARLRVCSQLIIGPPNVPKSIQYVKNSARKNTDCYVLCPSIRNFTCTSMATCRLYKVEKARLCFIPCLKPTKIYEMKAEINTATTAGEALQLEETQDALKSKVEEDKWLIRECDLYYDEYKECTSFRGRFQQYFVFGESLDCNQWKKDYDNCSKWESKQDLKAADALITSERNRRMARFRAHYGNDTWKKRESPPTDWDKPLPEWMEKRNENSFLAMKAKELREGKVEETKKSCSIM